MKNRFAAFAASLFLSSVMIPGAFAQNELNRGSSQDTHPDGRGDRTHDAKGASGGAVVSGNGISYHNGPVLRDTVNVYYIWYGDWTQDPGANKILTDWVQSIGGSPYENINTTYGDTVGNVSGAIAYAGSYVDSGSFGTSLTDANIASIVSSAMSASSGPLPVDTNGLYFVLTAPFVKETSGFLSQYCGWHTSGTIKGADIKYSFVGNPAGGLNSCAEQTTSSPNDDVAADAMVSVMAHELEETASDPDLNAWYDSRGNENADKCAWTFGTEYTVSNGSLANMKLGSRDYLIQQNWVNAKGGYCALSYSTTPDFSLSVSPASQTLPSTGGTTGTYTITETASIGFTGTVAYGITGLPAWAVATAVSSAGTFTVTAASPVSGTYPFTITGTSGSLVRTTSATLVISQPAQATFTIGISPTSRTVSRGQSVTYTVTIASQNGFSSSVALSAGPPQTGVSYSFSPASVPGGSGGSTFKVQTTNSAKRNTFTITVTGTGGGISKSVSVTLKIQ